MILAYMTHLASGPILAPGDLFAWLLVNRYRVAVLADRAEDEGLERAIAERRAEAMTGVP